MTNRIGIVLALWVGLGLSGWAVAGPQEAPPAAPTPSAPAPQAGLHGEMDASHDAAHATPDVHPFWIIPFVLLLASIAVMPLVHAKFWEHNYPWFAIILGSITAIYYLFFFDHPAAKSAWLHEMREYVSFIALLGSLYIVSGGIVIHVSRKATPTTNTMLLLTGAVLANVVGTTGAAMLLIRPFMRINRAHLKPYHIVFFIFIVANCGGALTPIGDPPLFMGYLKGVPFFWVAEAVWEIWAFCVVLLLAAFFVVDTLDHRKAARPHEHDAGPGVEIFGFQNFLFIGLILIGVFRPSVFQVIHDGDYAGLLSAREVMMVAAALASRFTTKPYIYQRNEFNYHPIKEVAILFVGIFSTMVPALNYLNLNSDQMPLKSPGQYYFVTGTLSAALDNAPTYLVFLETKQGQLQQQYGPQIEKLRHVLDDHPTGELPPKPAFEDKHVEAAYESLLKYNPQKVRQSQVTDGDIRIAMLTGNADLQLYLIAISLGSVFFGAMTYIGNGPNFMVKSIAEANGVRMPSFFGYVLKYSLPILLPIFLLVWVVFFVLKVNL